MGTRKQLQAPHGVPPARSGRASNGTATCSTSSAGRGRSMRAAQALTSPPPCAVLLLLAAFLQMAVVRVSAQSTCAVGSYFCSASGSPRGVNGCCPNYLPVCCPLACCSAGVPCSSNGYCQGSDSRGLALWAWALMVMGCMLVFAFGAFCCVRCCRMNAARRHALGPSTPAGPPHAIAISHQTDAAPCPPPRPIPMYYWAPGGEPGPGGVPSYPAPPAMGEPAIGLPVGPLPPHLYRSNNDDALCAAPRALSVTDAPPEAAVVAGVAGVPYQGPFRTWSADQPWGTQAPSATAAALPMAQGRPSQAGLHSSGTEQAGAATELVAMQPPQAAAAAAAPVGGAGGGSSGALQQAEGRPAQ